MAVSWLLLVICFFISTNCKSESVLNFVKPSETMICSFQPCLTINDYANQSGQYFVDNATFMFLAGVHRLDFTLYLENLSDVELQALIGEQVELALSHSIIWMNCTNIKISDLNFNCGRAQLEFSAIVFHQSKAILSNVSIFGSGDQRVQALFLNDSSEVEVNNLIVHGTASERGSALYALGSIIDISGHSTFTNNIAFSEGGAIALYDCASNFHGTVSFINNSAERFGVGGALVISGGNHTISGNLLFTSNTAYLNGGALVISGASYFLTLGSILFTNNTSINGMGGAIYMNGSSHDLISSNISFNGNSAPAGGAMALADGSYQISGNLSFIDNVATSYGGAISILDGQHIVSGTMLFANNSVISGFGGAMCVLGGSLNISGNHVFINNSALVGIGGAVAFLFGSCNYISGNLSFVKNTAQQGGAVLLNSGNLDISGEVSFIENHAMTYGGALAFLGGNNSISGNISFCRNVAFVYGGAVVLTFGNHRLSGLFEFTNNTATNGSGGAISIFSNSYISGNMSFIGNSAAGEGGAVAMYGVDVAISMTGTQSFINNSASQGGAIAMFGTRMMLASPFQARFIENYAEAYGGAVFISVDTAGSSAAGCVQLDPFTDRREDCLFEFDSMLNIHFNFSYNTAGRAGTVIYGGNFDTCRLYIRRVRDICGNMIGGNFSDDPLRTLNNISYIASGDNVTSLISSDPLRVCLCIGDSIECTEIDIEAVRGRKFTLQAVIVGQNGGTVPSLVRTSLDNGVRIDTEQRIQPTGKMCTPVMYRLFYNGNATILTLFPDNGVCRGTEAFRTKIRVTFLPCPDGFTLDGSACVCEERLQQYTTNCRVDDESIERSSNTFWMGTVYDNGSYGGVILHSGCPLDYCVDTPVNITLADLDIQCNHNHSGTLCGSCNNNYSIAFGTLHCIPCSSDYLALLLPFALVGIALVTVILLLQLSVAVGSLNGLIFYANVIQANRSIFFPPGKTNILTVFIAWLNLDLGIESCFYDGMTTYAFTWLQFVFPFYVLLLIALIILASHYSRKIAKIFGHNPVAALATLILLSYSKILRVVILALSSATLEYPDGTNRQVWLYDGTVPYFQRFDHAVLGMFAILALLVLFLPYTFLLFFGHWLQAYSHWRTLSWLNKIKPFMDAYHAPYKRVTRYWTGLTLLLRGALFLIFALNSGGNDGVNLLIVSSVSAGLATLAWMHHGVYEKLFNDILEGAFILNLCIFAAATYHVKQTGERQGNVANTSVGIAFSVFVCILLYHVYISVTKTSMWQKTLKPKAEQYLITLGLHCNNKMRDGEDDGEQKSILGQAPTSSSIELRESLLEK